MLQADFLQVDQSLKVKIFLMGNGARSEINCGYLLNDNNKINIDIQVLHKSGETSSSQVIRGLVTDSAKVSFNGTITIPYNSQKCDGHQNHRGVILSDKAEIEAVPQLEIWADDVKCDVILGTDPDCDRVAIAVPAGDGYRKLSGNELGCLLMDYILRSLSEKNSIPEGAIVVRSIVSSPLADRIAEAARLAWEKGDPNEAYLPRRPHTLHCPPFGQRRPCISYGRRGRHRRAFAHASRAPLGGALPPWPWEDDPLRRPAPRPL